MRTEIKEGRTEVKESVAYMYSDLKQIHPWQTDRCFSSRDEFPKTFRGDYQLRAAAGAGVLIFFAS